MVRVLLEPNRLEAGTHSFAFPDILSTGQYFLRIQAGEKVIVKSVRVL
jgi:hypothetical protein